MSRSTRTRFLPLAGKRVLVTRPRHQAGALSDQLRQAGATPVELPVIEIVPSASAELDAALENIAEYDWVIFTSVNTVKVVTERLRDFGDVRIAAIGDATAAALAERGIAVDLVPGNYVAAAVLEAMIERGVAGKKILLPSADMARGTLPDGLRAAGAYVDVIAAYVTRLPEHIDDRILDALMLGEIDIVTVTSPSTVHNLLALTGGTLPETTRIACIGPITAQAAREAGLKVDTTADEYTIDGLVQALIKMGDDDEPV